MVKEDMFGQQEINIEEALQTELCMEKVSYLITRER